MCQNHFERLYNSIPDDGACIEFHQKLLGVKNSNSFSKDCFSVEDVASAIGCQKKSKSAGPNGLVMESLMCAHGKLLIHLSLFFTFCIRHCFFACQFH